MPRASPQCSSVIKMEKAACPNNLSDMQSFSAANEHDALTNNALRVSRHLLIGHFSALHDRLEDSFVVNH